jgi:uncharacterized protein YlxP (DUF503 family)
MRNLLSSIRTSGRFKLAVAERPTQGRSPNPHQPLTAASSITVHSVVRFNSGVSSGYVGILSFELHFPEAGSLKGKRKYVKSTKAQLQNRFGASVAEVDHHDLWQRARLTMSCVARDERDVRRLLDEAERYLNGQEYELVARSREIVALGD